MGVSITQRPAIDSMPVIQVKTLLQGTVGSSTPGTYGDLTVNSVALSSSYNNFEFFLNDNFGTSEVTAEAVNPSVVSVENFPLVERESAGVGQVKLSHRGVSATYHLNMLTIGGSAKIEASGFSEDTIGAHAWAIIEPLLDAGGDLNILSGGTQNQNGTYNFTGATYNATCWCSDFDFSGVAHKNSSSNSPQMAGTAITNRHVLMAAHYRPAVGTVLTFIAPNGTAVTRTILGYNPAPDGGATSITGDKTVAVLSSALPETIEVYPVVGSWIYEALSATTYRQAWIGVKLDQHRRAHLAGVTHTIPVPGVYGSGTYNGESFSNRLLAHCVDWGSDINLPPFLDEYADFYTISNSGDSGSPRFYPLTGSTLALAGCASNAGGGAPVTDGEILNEMIAAADSALGINTGLTVTVAPDPTA